MHFKPAVNRRVPDSGIDAGFSFSTTGLVSENNMTQDKVQPGVGAPAVQVPHGYVMIADPYLGDFQALPGHRLELRSMTKVRSEMVRAQHAPSRRGRRGGDFLQRLSRVSAAVKDDKLPKGSVLAFSTAPRMPAALAAHVGQDRRWAWVPSLGGLIRLADGPCEGVDTCVGDMEAGDFFQDGSKGRIPGFGASQHPQWGWIKVRLPSDGELLGQATPPAPSDPGLAIRTEARELMAKMPGYTDAHRDWAMEAPIEEVRKWLKEAKSAKEGGAR